MSSVVIAGDTSGSITIAAPAVAGSNTLTLPAATGTVIYSNGSDNLLFNSGYGSLAVAYGCRAWVNFNGTGTVAIRASGNVTSITDNGVGDYTVNFTNAMPDINYAAVSTSGASSQLSQIWDGARAKTTTTYPIYTMYASSLSGGGGAVDSINVQIAIFR